MRKIGLIGGLALRAGIFYYEQIEQGLKASGWPIQIMLNHADVSRVLSYVRASDRAGLGNYLGNLANELANGGCEIVAVTAVAPHLAVSELTKVAHVQLANVLDAIPAGLSAAGVDRVAVFGNRAVMQTNVFEAVPGHMIVPLTSADLDWVHDTYNDIALYGKRATKPEMRELSRLANRLIQESGAQAILLAGTDLSSFYAEQKPDFPFIDVAQIHIDQIIRISSGL
jgi:aspartate/glutamate racemase